jgi:hypothetical protein
MHVGRRVLRLEHPMDNIGPFQSRNLEGERRDHYLGLHLETADPKRDMPTVYAEGLHWEDDWQCACQSPMLFGMWWAHNELRVLDRLGYVIRQFEVPPRHMQSGKTQCTFARGQSKLVAECRPLEWTGEWLAPKGGISEVPAGHTDSTSGGRAGEGDQRQGRGSSGRSDAPRRLEWAS